eukprot:934513-Rhodomonas_salina.1
MDLNLVLIVSPAFSVGSNALDTLSHTLSHTHCAVLCSARTGGAAPPPPPPAASSCRLLLLPHPRPPA